MFNHRYSRIFSVMGALLLYLGWTRYLTEKDLSSDAILVESKVVLQSNAVESFAAHECTRTTLWLLTFLVLSFIFW